MAQAKKYWKIFLIGVLLLIGLFAASLYNYLLFHALVEIFSIVVAFGIFMIVWNSRYLVRNSYLLFIGVAYLFVGSLDLIHTLAYKGMGVFPGDGANLATQLWIAARYVESISLLIGPFLIGRKLKGGFLFFAYTLTMIALLASVFYWNIFPACYIEGQGLTVFKKASEYIISFLLLTSIIALLGKRNHFEKRILQLLVVSIGLTLASEMVFTLYTDVYGLFNLTGHYLKIASFYLIYKAVVEIGLTEPYTVLFRDIKQSKDVLKTEKDRLEHETNESFIKLQDAELKYKTIADFTYDWESWEGPEGTYRYVSPSCERITGYKPEEFMENPQFLQKLILPEDKVKWDEHRYETIHKKGLLEIQFRIRNRDGQIRWIEHACQPVMDDRGVFFGFRASNRDITERKLVEKAVLEMASFAELNPSPVLRVDPNGVILSCNPASVKILGKNAKKGEILASVLPDFSEIALDKCIHGDLLLEHESYIQGRCYQFILRGISDLGLVHIYGSDITKRKQAEDEIRLLQDEYTHIARVSAMGELVASLAHELKQPLAAIRSNAQAAQRFLTGDKPDIDELHEVLKDIIKDNRRADDVITKLRSMMRKGQRKFKPLNINNIARETLPLVGSYEMSRNISLQLELDDNIPPVVGDRVQIQQVILNLILNSTEALMKPGMKSRTIMLRTNQENTQNVILTVKDNGPGISEEVMKSLFEPFYTTKPEGLGMGLAISRSIIEEHRGRLWAENNPDGGATFYFTIPIAKENLA